MIPEHLISRVIPTVSEAGVAGLVGFMPDQLTAAVHWRLNVVEQQESWIRRAALQAAFAISAADVSSWARDSWVTRNVGATVTLQEDRHAITVVAPYDRACALLELTETICPISVHSQQLKELVATLVRSAARDRPLRLVAQHLLLRLLQMPCAMLGEGPNISTNQEVSVAPRFWVATGDYTDRPAPASQGFRYTWGTEPALAIQPSATAVGVVDTPGLSDIHLFLAGAGPGFGSEEWSNAHIIELALNDTANFSDELRAKGLSYGASLRLAPTTPPALTSLTLSSGIDLLPQVLDSIRRYLSDLPARLPSDLSPWVWQSKEELGHRFEDAESAAMAITDFQEVAPGPVQPVHLLSRTVETDRVASSAQRLAEGLRTLVVIGDFKRLSPVLAAHDLAPMALMALSNGEWKLNETSPP